MCERKTLKARIAADLIDKFRKAEGIQKREGGQLADIREMNRLYDVQATRNGWYVATPRECAQ